LLLSNWCVRADLQDHDAEAGGEDGDFAKHLRPNPVAPSPQRQGPGYLVQRVIFCFSPGSFDLTEMLHAWTACRWRPPGALGAQRSLPTVDVNDQPCAQEEDAPQP
jgi:hypothetical protein